MTRKLALIVDDSKLARIKLGKRLEEHGLDVDSADSAEDALAYLQIKKPDIIFMDHTMPGMDGLQALRIIKEDPQTAMIPVVMYTSQEGEVYVGQARALGAMGVLPKSIQSTDLANILERLHLTIPADEADEAPAAETATEQRPASTASGRGGARVTPHPALRQPATRDDQVHQRLVDEIRAELRRQITLARQPLAEDLDLVKQQLVRVQRRHDEALDNIQRMLHEQQLVLKDLAEDRKAAALEAQGRGWRLGMAGLALVLLVAGAMLLGRYWESETSRKRLELQVAQQASEIERLRNQASDRERMMANLASPAVLDALPDASGIAEALIWGFNQAGGFDYGEKALGDERARRFGELLDRLEAAGYAGPLRLDLHFGRFCLDDAGQPAPEETPIAKCRIAPAGMEDAYLPVNQESMAFARLLDAHPALQNGLIRVEVVSHGTQDPLEPYPAQAMTAGEWNRVARRNNRVLASLPVGE